MRSFVLGRCGAAVAVLALATALIAAPVQACGLDGTPSVSANGRLAQVTPWTPTTQAQMAIWAIFDFTRHYAVRQAITLTENRREVARALIASAMQRPWRWRFGDGQTAYGWTVRHAFARPGTWRIMVDAYLPSTKQWYNFDQVMIVITR